MKAWLALGALVASAGNLVAQAERPTPLPVGTVAPDFTLPSATRTGLGKPVSLRDFRGQVVVLAFFFRARTSG